MLNQTLLEWQPSWSDGAASNTSNFSSVGLPNTGASGDVIIIVENPSQHTALRIQPQVKSRVGSRVIYSDYGDPLIVSANSNKAFLIKSFPVDSGGQLVVSNVDPLPNDPLSGGFTAYIKVIAL